MNTTQVRRSSRIAAKMAPAAIQKLLMMLKDAEKNNDHNVTINEKILHIINIFKFIMDERLKSLIAQNETFRLSVKNRIYNITESLKYQSIPFWIATEYTDVSRNLMEYILDIEQNLQ
jgi:hypothetical protein